MDNNNDKKTEEMIKTEHSRMSVRVLNQAPEDRALWVWTQAVQAGIAKGHVVEYATNLGDIVLEEARKRFGGIL